MPAAAASPRCARSRRRDRCLGIGHCTPIIPLVVARQVVEDASRWLDESLPEGWAVELLFRAQGCFMHASAFRKSILRPGDYGRDTLYVFMRHWLAACLRRERPDLFHRLPRDYACGAELPLRPAAPHRIELPAVIPNDRPLSPDARLLAEF